MITKIISYIFKREGNKALMSFIAFSFYKKIYETLTESNLYISNISQIIVTLFQKGYNRIKKQKLESQT